MTHPGPTLTVDLSALAANYRILQKNFSGGECAAVVKANAYGLGVREVALALENSGCRTFFVATLEEGVELRTIFSLPHRGRVGAASPEAAWRRGMGADLQDFAHNAPHLTSPLRGEEFPRIYVFHGPYAGEEKDYAAHNLIPVLNSMEQVERWQKHSSLVTRHSSLFALHVDTGMNRLGLTQTELEQFAQRTTHTAQLLISHLACANEADDPKNAEQLAHFRAARALLPKVPTSLCNSSGIFLGRDFHFDVARPGCALYGITERKNPMKPVVTLSAPILQVRTADSDGTVGYGATCPVKKGAKLAIAQLGYADGYFRSLSNAGVAFIGGLRVPVAGRVSMDMIALDVTAVPQLAPHVRAEFLNAEYTVDALARDAGTIGYEVLTRLGARVRRVYNHAN